MIAAGDHGAIRPGLADVHGAQRQSVGAVLVGESQPQPGAALRYPHHLPHRDIADVGGWCVSTGTLPGLSIAGSAAGTRRRWRTRSA